VLLDDVANHVSQIVWRHRVKLAAVADEALRMHVPVALGWACWQVHVADLVRRDAGAPPANVKAIAGE